MVITASYIQYANYVKAKVASGDISDFKSHPDYTYMLEHVTPEYGQQYLDCILAHTPLTLDEVALFCGMNDAHGKPNTFNYGPKYNNLQCSPTSLRYLYHAHLILRHFEGLNMPNVNLVEIGGGYGGLFLAIQFMRLSYRVAIESYTIVDLPEITELQRMYTNQFQNILPVEFVSAYTFGEGIQKPNMCLISCYCFSEIAYELQKGYIDKLFPRIQHGFIAWNHIPIYNFGFRIREEPEVPQTASKYNRYVYF